MSEITDLNAAISRALLSQMEELRGTLAPLVESMTEQILKRIGSITEKLNEIGAEIEKQSRVAGPALKEAGFWVPEHASQEFLEKLFLIAANESRPAEHIRQLFVAEYHADNFALLRDIAESWFGNNYFDGRQSVIKAAFDAHTRKEYELSIPALLPVIEGILVGIAGPSYRRPYNQPLQHYANEIIGQRYDVFFSELSKNAILEFVTGISFYGNIKRELFYPDLYDNWLRSTGLDPLQCLNRHAILHGVQKEYAGPENSLRAFLLLDVLAEIAQPSNLTFSKIN